MNQNPIIKALREDLAKERDDLLDAYLHKQVVEMNVTRNAMDNSLVGFRHGHEAASARLLGLLTKAIEVIEFYGGTDCYAVVDENGCVDGSSEEQPGLKAREFLTTLADASGDMKDKGEI